MAAEACGGSPDHTRLSDAVPERRCGEGWVQALTVHIVSNGAYGLEESADPWAWMQAKVDVVAQEALALLRG